MRRLLLMIGALLMIAAPVSAQFVTPTPAPESPEMQALDRIAQTLSAMSANNSSTVNGVSLLLAMGIVIVLLAVLLFVAWLFRGGAKPVFEQIEKANRRADAAEQSETHLRVLKEDSDRKADEYRARTAESLERTANILAGMETQSQAQHRTDTAVIDLKSQISTDGDATRKALKEVVEKVGEVKDVVEKAATVEALETALTPVKEQLAAMNQTLADVVRRIGTDELKPSHAADPPSSSSIPGVPS